MLSHISMKGEFQSLNAGSRRGGKGERALAGGGVSGGNSMVLTQPKGLLKNNIVLMFNLKVLVFP